MQRRSGKSVGIAVGCVAALFAASCGEILGIGDPVLDPELGAGGQGQGTGGSSVTAGPGSTAQSSAQASSGSGSGVAPCAQTKPECTAVKSDCVSVFDNNGLTDFALRIGQASFFKPDAFTGSFEQQLLLGSITLNLSQCNLNGSGTFSWIVELNTETGKFTVGTSKPAADPHNGYAFVNETITQAGESFKVEPATGDFTIGPDGVINASVLEKATLPVYLDAKATSVMLIPMHNVRLFDTKLSADQNCVGQYNEWGLKPEDGCLPNVPQNVFSFISGGKVDGYILLEEADKVIITAYGLNRSLCVLLSTSANLYGDGGSPARCKRDGNGVIKFPGDWCSTTNQGADPTCYDALLFSAAIAASGVKLQ